MRNLIFGLLALCFAIPVSAQTRWAEATNLNRVDLSTSPEFQRVDVSGRDQLIVEVEFIGDGDATDVQMTCQQSPNGSKWFKYPDCSGATSPTLTCGERVYSWATTSTENFFFLVPLYYKYLKCGFSGTGATSPDLITISLTTAVNNG